MAETTTVATIERNEKVPMVSKFDAGLPAFSVMPKVKITQIELFNKQADEIKLKEYVREHTDMKLMGIVGWYARYSDNLGTNADGSQTAGYQLMLLTEKGEVIRVSSQVLINRFKTLFNMFGIATQWQKPFNLQLKRIDVPKGESWDIIILP